MGDKMYRDSKRRIVPQILTENGYSVLSNGNMDGIDVGKYKLLVDKRGDVLPHQYFDVNQMKFVSGFPPSLGGDIDEEKLQLIDEINAKVSNLPEITPRRLPTETNDSNAIQRAIQKAYDVGGGIIRWNGNLEIVRPINIHDEKIQFKGIGETSAIRAMVDMPYVIKADYHSQYGNRGLNWSDFYVDCNNRAQDGIILGSVNPVVQSMFSNIKVKNALNYGLIIDGSQNNLFSLVDVENCGGNLKLINGAGNNTFVKCEFNESKGKHHIYMGSDSAYGGFGNNGFSDIPQSNHFYNCITERGPKETCIYIERGKSNTFNAHEFESGQATECVIKLGQDANLNIFSGRIAHSSSDKVPIINNGYQNFFSDMYVENSNNEYFARTSNYLTLSNIILNNRSVKVQNTAGDSASNIRTGFVNYTWEDPYTMSLLPSQLVYKQEGNEPAIYFRGKEKTVQVQSGRQFSGSVRTEAGGNHSLNIPLTKEGTWLIDVTVNSDDYNHMIGNTFNARYRNNSSNDLKNIQKTLTEDAQCGWTVNNLSATINEMGVVTVTVKSEGNKNVRIVYSCRQISEF